MPQGLLLPYKEHGIRDGGSPTLAVERESQAGHRRISVDWSQHVLAAAQVLGFSRRDDDNNIVRHLPEYHPYQHGIYATACRVEPHQWAGRQTPSLGRTPFGYGNTLVYEKAYLDVEYGFLPFAVLDESQVHNEVDRYVEWLTDAKADYLSLPCAESNVQWAETGPGGKPTQGNTVPGSVGPIEPSEVFTLRWHQVPYGYFLDTIEPVIRDTVGATNSKLFGRQVPFDDEDVADTIYQAESLLMLGAGWRVHMQPNGKLAVTVEYMMQFLKAGHNHVLDFLATPPDYFQVSIGGVSVDPDTIDDGYTIYKYRDFFDLFGGGSIG